MFNYNHLYYFYVTAKLNGVTAASRQLKTSQPSLSAQIKNLESTLGRQLFRKSGRHMELTDEGQQIYSYCKQMFEIADDLEHFTKGSDQLKREKVSIGVSPEIERPFIANAIGTTLKKCAEKNRPVVSMLSQPEEELKKSLKFSKMDFIISDAPVYESDLEVKATYSMPVIFFLSPDLATDLKIGAKESVIDSLKKASNHLALPTSSLRLRQESDLFLQKKKIKFNMVFETDILAAIIRSVTDGISAGILPLPYVLKEARRGLLRIIAPAEGLWQHKIFLITKKDMQPSIFLETLIAVLDSESKAMGRFSI